MTTYTFTGKEERVIDHESFPDLAELYETFKNRNKEITTPDSLRASHEQALALLGLDNMISGIHSLKHPDAYVTTYSLPAYLVGSDDRPYIEAIPGFVSITRLETRTATGGLEVRFSRLFTPLLSRVDAPADKRQSTHHYASLFKLIDYVVYVSE